MVGCWPPDEVKLKHELKCFVGLRWGVSISIHRLWICALGSLKNVRQLGLANFLYESRVCRLARCQLDGFFREIGLVHFGSCSCAGLIRPPAGVFLSRSGGVAPALRRRESQELT